MTNQQVSRRQLLKWMGVSSAAVALAACAPAPGPAATTDQGEAAAPSTASKTLSIATYADPRNEWQRVAAKEWAAENPDVELNIDEVIYAEMNKKQLAALATGTLWDVSFSGIKWFPYVVSKGAFLALEDLIAANDPGMDDFFSAAIAGSSWEGKIYGLPYLMHPGNPALIIFNKDLMAERGVEMPASDDWTTADYLDLIVEAADAANGIFGTNYLPGNYYDFCSLARSYGGDILSEDGMQFTFNTDPQAVEACQWVVSLRAEHQAAPARAEAEGLQFAAGTLATSTLGTYAVRSLEETIADKFEWDLLLHPTGPDGIRGYQGFVECFSVYAESQNPDLAFDLVVKETNTEVGVYSVLNSSNQPTARKSVWEAPELADLHPIFRRALDWMSNQPGPFPMPGNLRFQELQDTWANTSPELFYGEVGFEEGMQLVQDECQAIVELPRA
jgi:ABC-type glycerol-3-phosphate transport system substrate-binding protein